MVWIREVVVVGVSGVMVAGVEVVVIGVNREGGQRRGEIGGGREEIGKTTNWICTGGRAFHTSGRCVLLPVVWKAF